MTAGIIQHTHTRATMIIAGIIQHTHTRATIITAGIIQRTHIRPTITATTGTGNQYRRKPANQFF